MAEYIKILNGNKTWTTYKIKHPSWLRKLWWKLTGQNWKLATLITTEREIML